MKAFLLYRNVDFVQREQPLPKQQTLTEDLELDTLFGAMAGGDEFLSEVVRRTVLAGMVHEIDTILYRQGILRDCLQNPSIVREIYTIVTEAVKGQKKIYFGLFADHPSSILYRSIQVLRFYIDALRKIRSIADAHADKFESEGFQRFFTMIKEELSDEYFAEVERHLKELQFRDGVLISAKLGNGNKGIEYTLRRSQGRKRGWLDRLRLRDTRVCAFTIDERDESGIRALADLRDRGINVAANALAQSAEHILAFLTMVRLELAFYIGCLNLHTCLIRKGEPICFPQPVDPDERRCSFRGLYDVCLALRFDQRVVGNDGDLDKKNLVIITGANQGGKSTFLRSIGLAQLMMQCGMFVGAESFCASVCLGVFTHFKREEDANMRSGKFDEELKRMSEIVDRIRPGSLLLLNESFAATNEREGSEVARQISQALVEAGVRILFVTHFYELAQRFFAEGRDDTVFLRAERRPDGRRTFRIREGEPLATSHGEDLYYRIFRTMPDTAPAAPADR